MIDFGDRQHNEDLMHNEIMFSEYVAGRFLEKIPESLYFQDGNQAGFEITTEGFLFFIIRGRDRLFQKINNILNLNINPEAVKLSMLRDKLKQVPKDHRARDILKLIDNCHADLRAYNNHERKYNQKHRDWFGGGLIGNAPEFEESMEYAEMRNRTWLSELASMRNAIAHRNCIPEYFHRLGDFHSKMSMIVWQWKDPTTGKYAITVKEENPKRYFQLQYERFKELRKNVIDILEHQ